jgi:hypothetical protein
VIPRLHLSEFWLHSTISAFEGLAEEARGPLLGPLATEDFFH